MPTYRIGGIAVEFPYNAYDCQLVYMERVISALQKGSNALLESPTGTGKTLCLLCATLAWRESLAPPPSLQSGSQQPTQLSARAGSSRTDFNKPDSDPMDESLQRLPTIVYASRTHSQLQQVIRELKATIYRPKMVVLGSREQMCIHSDVQSMRGRVQNHACRSLTKGRNCHHYNRVADYVKGHPELGKEPIDIEDLVTIGRSEGPCPYFLSRELHNTADILFVPYNYLIEKENRRSLTGISWSRTVLIFDEAHNLEGICAEAASFDLPAAHLTACIGEAKQCVDLASARKATDNGADTSLDPDNFAVLKALLLELEKRINEIPINSSELGFTRPGSYIYEFLADIKITYETVTMLIDTIDQATGLLEDEANGRTGGGKVRPSGGTMYRLQALRDALRIIFRDNNVSHAGSYKVHVHEPGSRDGDRGARKGGKAARVLSWWCFNPGIAMEEFAKLGVRSVILTSGTLSPLDSFAFELNLPFDVRLENPHVIDANQIWVGVVSMGPSGRPLNSSYRTRDSIEYKLELGNTIVNFARIVPDGLLVFFPSYYLLNSCIEAWQIPMSAATAKGSTVWERICRNKQPVVEPRESALFNQANEDFCAKINDTASSGAVFFAVCRGKVSEGLDFADRAGRAVVVTGIPFAMKMDPKVRLKREYLDEQMRQSTTKSKTLSGEEWYVQQASRAVNQAVGRVIRHRHDYGAIILCDERFAQAGPQSQMSLWLRPHIKCYSKFGDSAFTLTRFFRDKVGAAGPVKPLNSLPAISDASRATSQLLASAEVEKKRPISVISNEPTSLFQSDLPHGLLSFSPGDIVKSNDGSFKRSKTPMPLGPLISPHYPGLVGPTAPQELLSTMLAASRKAKASQPLMSFAITAANRAMGSAPGIVHVSDSITTMNASVGLSEKNLEPGLCNKKNEVASSAAGDPGTVKSAVASLSAPVGLRSDDDNVDNGASTSPNDSGTGAVEGGLQQVQALSASKPVKAHLSVGEYKGFLECMRGLKNQTINMSNLLQLISNLFSAPERLFLLCRFGDFVPSQHQPAYNLLLEAKQAEHGVPPGENRIEQSKTRLSLAGFSSHSRKQVLDRGSAGPS
ncbi:hypothetical protein BDL97_16G056800 [Sphagnum fallax]|nr:hypothetical protein BDL97_16G056800 [Sphagnum fallax]